MLFVYYVVVLYFVEFIGGEVVDVGEEFELGYGFFYYVVVEYGVVVDYCDYCVVVW